MATYVKYNLLSGDIFSLPNNEYKIGLMFNKTFTDADFSTNSLSSALNGFGIDSPLKIMYSFKNWDKSPVKFKNLDEVWIATQYTIGDCVLKDIRTNKYNSFKVALSDQSTRNIRLQESTIEELKRCSDPDTHYDTIFVDKPLIIKGIKVISLKDKLNCILSEMIMFDKDLSEPN